MSCHRRLTTFLATVIVASTVTLVPSLVAASASARVPNLPHNYLRRIENLAPYVGQKRCTPAPKPGTVAFANMLLRTYPRSRSLGISRSCKVGGASEHKEGRAFDWGMSAYSAVDRRQVKTLLAWLLKTDRYGNKYAMARRLGIQYMIWNHRIWGSYSASSGWRRYTGSNPHTDHVHFSLSWAGARKLSSFWHPRSFPNVAPPPSGSGSGSGDNGGSDGGAPTPTDPHQWPDHGYPVEIPEPRSPASLEAGPVLRRETVMVRSSARAGTRTDRALQAGHSYLIEATGTWRYDARSTSVADPECSTSDYSWWRRDRSVRPDDWNADHLDLYIDGHDLYSEADNGDDCDNESHTYRWVYTASRTGRVPLTVWDPTSYKDNSGRLKVRILDQGVVKKTVAWTVPAKAAAGVTSPAVLPGGHDYQVTVSGSWDDGNGGSVDAACASTTTYPGMRRTSYAMKMGQFDERGQVPQVVAPDQAGTSLTPGCTSDHTYSWVWHANRTQPLNVRVFDPSGYADNDGSLRVSVTPYTGDVGTTPTPTPTPEPTPDTTPGAGDLTVAGNSATPTVTAASYAQGTQLKITASGTYSMRGGSDWIAADAECTITTSDLHWRSVRYEGTFNGSTQPLGDLTINGRLFTWEPSDGYGYCDEKNHTYVLHYTVPRNGPLSFVVADDYYGDNSGALAVSVVPE